jgi:GT2 family glycosyltransferase
LLIVSDRGFHYLAPNLIDENGISHFKRKFVAARTDVINYRGGPFNGILLSMELIKAIGFPMRRFFIWGDELEYVNRIEEAGFHVATVQKAIHFHKRPNTFRNPKRGFYFVRNRIYCYRLFQGIYRSKLIYLGGSLFEIFRFTIAVIKRLKLSELIQIIHGFFVGWKTNLDAEKVESQWWGIDLHKND